MFKRTFWFTVGTVAGAGGTLWANRRMRQAAVRFTPERVVDGVANKVRDIRLDLRDAAQEGRAAMRQQEAVLRAEIIER